MLDLNLGIMSRDSSCESQKHNKINNFLSVSADFRLVQMDEDSNTSNSSIIINSEEALNNFNGDENSSTHTNNNTFSFVFDILKNENKNPVQDLATKTLFPELNLDVKSGLATVRPHQNQWLKLSQTGPTGGAGSRDGEGEAELKIVQQKQQQMKKSRRGPRSRSSQYRGVTFYRRTGRWESHIWDCGKQVYLGGFDTALSAARAYDRAAVKFRGVDADINFTLSDYEDDMKHMKNLSKEEFVHILRRQSSGFARGSSKYRGVTLHKCGRWEARMGQFHGKKAYDMAAIRCNGREAVTNFEPSVYEGSNISHLSCEGSDHNLDLSLGISMAANDSNGINIEEKPVVESASSPAYRGSLPYDGLVPSNQERNTKKKAAMISSTKASNWLWKVNGNNISSSSSNKNNNINRNSNKSLAASSGFPSASTATPSSTIFSFNQNNHSVNNNDLRFTTPTTSTLQNCLKKP